MGLFKKKIIPSELPELALDDLESNKEVHDYLKKEESKNSPTEAPKEEPVSELKEVQKAPETKPALEPEKKVSIRKENPPVVAVKPSEENNASKKEVVQNQPLEKKLPSSEEKSFFGDLQNDLNEEISDFSQFEGWYKDKFEKRDVINDMKIYWENQKTASIISILGKSFQEKISQKIIKLQELEKNWQGAYFELIQKEEEIKEQELELKELLAEFVRVCKSKVDSSSEKGAKLKTSVVKKSINVKSSIVKNPQSKKVAEVSVKKAKLQNAKTKKIN